jgi:hypothetical protein
LTFELCFSLFMPRHTPHYRTRRVAHNERHPLTQDQRQRILAIYTAESCTAVEIMNRMHQSGEIHVTISTNFCPHIHPSSTLSSTYFIVGKRNSDVSPTETMKKLSMQSTIQHRRSTRRKLSFCIVSNTRNHTPTTY